MIVIAIAVEQDDRNRSNATGIGLEQSGAGLPLIERSQHLAVRGDPLSDLDDALVEHFRQHDLPREEVGPILVANAQGVPKTVRDGKHRSLALALEQRIRCDRRAHLDGFDQGARYGRVRRDVEQITNALERRIFVLIGVFGQQLVGHENTVGAPGDNIGERAAAIDPELPPAWFPLLFGFELYVHRVVLFGWSSPPMNSNPRVSVPKNLSWPDGQKNDGI